MDQRKDQETVYLPRSEFSVPYESSPWTEISDESHAALDRAMSTTATDSDVPVSTIPKETLERLLNGECIDDIAVSDWGRLLQTRSASDKRFRRLYVLTSHWTNINVMPKCDVDSFDLIFFPTHLENHWIFIWLDLIDDTLSVYDSLQHGPGSNAKSDTWSATISPLIDKILAWFAVHALFERKFEIQCVRQPIQRDTVNCGVWTLLVQDAVARDIWLHDIADWADDPTIMHVARIQIAASLVTGQLE